MVATGQVVTGGGAPHTHPWSEVTGEPAFALAADLEALDSSTATALAGKASAASVTTLAESVTAVSGRVTALEEEPAAPVLVKRWNGSAYVDAPDARLYVGDGDPGTMPEGSVWIGPE